MGKRLSLNIDLNQAPRIYAKRWDTTENNVIYSDKLKRAIDFILSLLFIITVGWFILPLIAILISIDSKGPVFFRQLRNGYKGKKFYCLKFRTMYYPCEQQFQQATKNDSRITRIGKLLRKTSLDELPQIFNILNGDMSLVGPRPHPIPLDDEYSGKIGSYLERYDSKPGLTGLAQIKGFRGETATDYDMKNRLRMDLVYVKRRNVLMDIRIIFKSFLLIFKGGPNAF
ncbi:MAG: sugar transferase [Cytophagales bacterium]